MVNSFIMKKIFSFFFLIISFTSFSQSPTYKESYRPQYHFSPAKNWCNDPNGLVYYKNQYHLFYQHNPLANVWGHMTWAHAVSNDLVHWKHLPIAIPEENGVMIFSGTCVADVNNTSGFGKNGQVPLIAIYTGHTEGVNQSQHLAYSLDDGITWIKYSKNPILDLNKKDFRDPKVFWYAPKKYWVMCLMFPVEHVVKFYSSKNLIDWSYLSDFGPAGDTSGVWECPDLVQVPVSNGSKKSIQKKWLLQMSMNGSMQYFVGDFDGVQFKNETPADKIFRPDYGPDYYAAISYNQLPPSHAPISIGWVNNWYYANDIPTTPWKGAMSLPRELFVKKINNEWVLIQKPVEQFSREQKMIYKDFKVGFHETMKLPTPSLQQYMVDFSLGIMNGASGGIRIATGDGHEIEIGWNSKDSTLYLDRSKASNQSFNTNFAKMNRFQIPYTPSGPLEMKVYVDHSIIEVFVNGGERVMTAQFFPSAKDNGIEFFSNSTYAAGVGHCYVYEIRSSW